MLLHGMNDCKGSRPAYKPEGSCVLDVSLRKNLRAVDPTLLCGAETFSLDTFEHGWNGILVAGSRFPPGNEPSFWYTVRCNAGHRMENLFPTLGCWQSVCPCRRRDDLYSSPQVWMREDRSHPPCRSCDSIQPRVFDPEAVSCRLITPVVVPKNKSEAPDSCQYRYEFQVHAMLADQKLARNWPSTFGTQSQ
jgi:hypothetical protein